jgi:hypothetical protein
MFVGLVKLNDTLRAYFQVVDPAINIPVEPDAAPRTQVYGPSGLLSGAGGTASAGHTGSVTGATNANPIVVSSAAHNLTTGTKVVISGVLTNTAANGTFAVTVLSSSTFSIPATGNGAYGGGGTWKVAGFYYYDLAATGATGFEANENYAVYWSFDVSAARKAALDTFGVT